MFFLFEIELNTKISIHSNLHVKCNFVNNEDKAKQNVKCQFHHTENNEIKKLIKQQRIQQKKTFCV